MAALKPIQTPLWIMLGIVAAFIILLNLAGFIIAAGLFIAVFSVYMAGDNRPVYIARMLAVGFAISFAVNYIFTEILSYILP